MKRGYLFCRKQASFEILGRFEYVFCDFAYDPYYHIDHIEHLMLLPKSNSTNLWGFFIFIDCFGGSKPVAFQDINVQNGGERLADALRQVLAPAEVIWEKQTDEEIHVGT